MLNRREASVLMGAAAAALWAPAAAAETSGANPQLTAPATGPIVTRKSGVFNGVHVAYDAIVEPVVVTNSEGHPAARLMSISYIARGAHGGANGGANRPVIFVFNGGPITSSSTLHMGAFGPKRVAIPDDINADPATFRVVDNPYTVLDVADVVFFDPASTGFSRVLEGVDPKSYYSVVADGQQCAQFVAEWRRVHNRAGSPLYAFGESYGTMRAASLANQLQKMSPVIPLSGVFLMGQALNIVEFCQRPANIISYVVSLPTLTAIAWSHGKADLGTKTFEQHIAECWEFSRTDYLDALFKGKTLDAARKQAIAARLAAYTGLSADFYLAHDLRLSKEAYRRELFRDQHQILGMDDGRYKGPVAPVGQPAPNPSNLLYQSMLRHFVDYARTDLHIPNTDQYVPIARDIGEWDYGGNGPFSDWPFPALLTEVFAANPRFKVAIGNGYQDTQTTVGAAQYLVDQTAWPSERVSLHFYQGGHMAYTVEDSLRRMMGDVRALLAPA